MRISSARTAGARQRSAAAARIAAQPAAAIEDEQIHVKAVSAFAETARKSVAAKPRLSARQRLMPGRSPFLLHAAHRLAHLALALRLRQILKADDADRLLLRVADQDALDL